MNTDIRLSVDFWDHPKTVKLERALSLQGVKALQVLWLWAAKNRPCGTLSSMDADDIEIAAKWKGKAGRLVETLVALRWIDKTEKGFTLHNWKKRNAWAASDLLRSDKARLSRMAQTYPELYQKLTGEGRSGISRALYDELTASVTPTKESQAFV